MRGCDSALFLAVHVGTARFVKAEVSAQHHVTVGPSVMGQPGLVASLVGSVGVVRPLTSAAWGLSQSENLQGAAAAKHGVVHLCDRLDFVLTGIYWLQWSTYLSGCSCT
jgi:hypothetical protein